MCQRRKENALAKILCLSGYDAESHQRWRRGLLRSMPQHQWTVLSLPPRFFSWRSRGNALTWAFSERETLEAKYDLLLATSMVDLSTLRGLVPALTKLPTYVYFHENQFVYPIRQVAQRERLHFCMLNLYTALAADSIAFNSSYNRDTLLQGAKALLKRMPDCVPPGIVESIEERSTVLPVPLEERCFTKEQIEATTRPSILWNHRWEYDKAPERFFHALFALSEQNVDFELHVVGQRFRKSPKIFDEAKERLAPYIETWGYLEDANAYRALLRRCDIAVSTALHEFQGLALLEAVAAGCRPLVPNRLAYPEWIPPRYLYDSFTEDEDKEQRALVAALQKALKTERERHHVALDTLSWTTQKYAYAQWLGV